MTGSAILIFGSDESATAAAVESVLGAAAVTEVLPLLPHGAIDWRRTEALAQARAQPEGDGCLILLLPDQTAATGHERQATVARLRALADGLAPRLRVNALIGADVAGLRSAATLIAAAPTMTGQVLWLGALPVHPTVATAALARPAPALPRLRRMFIRDLELACRIGVYRHEHLGVQRVRINLELGVRDETPVGDRLDEVVCYDRIATGVRAAAAAGHVNLVETLAERIAEICLDDPRVVAARVRIEKLDIFADAASAGIEIERTNSKA